ncbi:hypothetical protein [Bradyrhizobium sp. Ash2021]|uniref:hypothetical protein n=1 Tax=Bradyrhizobium sp. Ash2021 TaxID=2954771 RepID=UPI0028151E77|nr:hypothetical protein [Bradyrhizobium sp. Ash2021]WMT72440.1 hypothetical protein NL528_31005 [Bradyrhizobium sp. Ash2021]
MAEEAFALSPISARAVQPGEEDYAAISEAFMETSRGRWFLGEYAKRNRNADTRMVLDAVARIEQSLAAQKEDSLQSEASLAAQQQLAAAIAANAGLEEARLAAAKLAEVKSAEAKLAEAKLAEALAVIQSAVGSAQTSATEALDALALEQKLAPVRKGARVIREIAWRLREIGNDGRICDLIDSQVAVIEAGAGEISAEEARAALHAAFAAIAGRLAEFSDDAAPTLVAEAAVADALVAEAAVSETVAVASPSPAPRQAVAETIEADPVEVAPVEIAAEAPTSSLAPAAELASAEAEAALAQAEAAEVAEVTDAAADAHDEAVLDLIAQEMGAPDEFEIDDTATMIAEEAHITELAPAEFEIAAEAPEPIVAEPAEPMAEMPAQAAVKAAPEPAIEMSLGSSIIASGMLRKPGGAANDPLAPIRRMSQAEKIAFFS